MYEQKMDMTLVSRNKGRDSRETKPQGLRAQLVSGSQGLRAQPVGEREKLVVEERQWRNALEMKWRCRYGKIKKRVEEWRVSRGIKPQRLRAQLVDRAQGLRAQPVGEGSRLVDDEEGRWRIEVERKWRHLCRKFKKREVLERKRVRRGLEKRVSERRRRRKKNRPQGLRTQPMRPQGLRTQPKEKGVLKVGCWNVFTLNRVGGFALLTKQLAEMGMDVVGISEHRWLDSGSMTGHQGWTLYYHDAVKLTKPPYGVQAGVALALSPRAKAAMISWQGLSERLVTMRFKINGGYLSVVQVYSPTDLATDAEKDKFYDDVEEVLNKAPNKDQLIVMGDFNANVGNDSGSWRGVLGPVLPGVIRSDNGQRLLELAARFELSIVNSFFKAPRYRQMTWVSPDGHTAVKDYLLVRQKHMGQVRSIQSIMHNDVDSDHRLLKAVVHLRPMRAHPKMVQRRFDTSKFGDPAVVEQFQSAIQSELQGTQSGQQDKKRRQRKCADPAILWGGLKSAMLTAAQKKIGYCKRKTKPWMTAEVFLLVQQKQQVWSRWLKTKRQEDRDKYIQMRRQVQRQIRKCKNEWWAEKARKMEEDGKNGRQKALWATLKSLRGKRARGTDNIVDEKGNLLQSEEETRARWQRHFSEVLNPRVKVTGTVPPAPREMQDDSLALAQEPSLEEVEKCINRIKMGKAAGKDDLLPEFFRYGGKAVVKKVTEIIQSIWASEKVPAEWKDAVLIPVYKKGGRRQCDNYRGISLIAIAGKVFAVLLMLRILSVANKKLLEAQSGFRPERGTPDEIFVIRQLLERCRDYKVPLSLCFVDISKAYDSVDRPSLIQVLPHYDVPCKVARLVEALYDDTKCQVRVGGQLSEAFEVKTGVRQGCPLSSLLFNIFIDYVVCQAFQDDRSGVLIKYRFDPKDRFDSWISKPDGEARISLAMYADDMALMDSSDRRLDSSVTKLNDAMVKWGLTMSVKKTKIMRRTGEEPTSRKARMEYAKLHPDKDLPFQCDECPRTFDSNRKLQLHKYHHQKQAASQLVVVASTSQEAPLPAKPSSFSCRKGCGFVSSRQSSMLAHEKACTGEDNRYPCPECPRIFGTQRARWTHLSEEHPNKTGRKRRAMQTTGPPPPATDFICPKCNKQCKSQSGLTTHLRRSHKDGEHDSGKRHTATCPHCKRSFVNKVGLKNHMLLSQTCKLGRVEQPEEKDEVETVETTDSEDVWTGGDSLEEGGVLIDSGIGTTTLRLREKPAAYTCGKCGSGFAIKGSCAMHEKTCDGTPKYRCPLCAAKFFLVTKYREHTKGCRDRHDNVESEASDTDEDQQDPQQLFKVGGKRLEEVSSFVYLGSSISTDVSMDVEVSRRISSALRAYASLKCLWKLGGVTMDTKMKVFNASVATVLLYGSETWNADHFDISRMRACYMRCLRGIARMHQVFKIPSELVLEKTGQPTVEELMRRRRMRWLGHVLRMEESRAPKQLLFAKLAKDKKKGYGTGKRWLDLVREDVKELGLPGGLLEQAQHRAQWRRAIKCELSAPSTYDATR